MVSQNKIYNYYDVHFLDVNGSKSSEEIFFKTLVPPGKSSISLAGSPAGDVGVMREVLAKEAILDV